MKIIDLLNKIANGEEVPKKIKYDDEIFTLNEIILENREKNIDYYLSGRSLLLFEDIINVHLHLNDEVEIINEPKEDKIEKLEYYDNSIMWCMNDREITDNEKDLIDKINEIIDRLNKE